MTGLPRRELLRTAAAAGIGIAAGAIGGWTAAIATDSDALGSPAVGGEGQGPSESDGVDPHGAHQAGVARPATPPPHGCLVALSLPDVPPPDGADDAFRARIGSLLAELGDTISSLAAPGRDGRGEQLRIEAGLLDGPGDLTITVGVGPDVVAAFGSALPGSEDLPVFVGDEAIPEGRSGGSILIAAYSSSPNDAASAADFLAARTGGEERWRQRGFRTPGEGTVARNPIGFLDGIIVPRTADELAEHVWIADGPLAGATICVVRRLRIDARRFRGEHVSRQEAVVGRSRRDGAPLSGGGRDDEVDLLAKTPEGEYLVPARAHARAAHPSFTGSALMLRRGYAFDDGPLPGDGAQDAGLLFICFQRDLRTFVQTQHRLDEADDLMCYVTPTGGATFLILPGFSPERPLGTPLVASSRPSTGTGAEAHGAG